MKRGLFIIFIFLFVSRLYSQQENHFACGSSFVNTRILKQTPHYNQSKIKNEKLYQKEIKKRIATSKLSSYKSDLKSREATLESALITQYTLPVVVHIVHNNGSENLADDKVNQAIQNLNDAFANTGLYNSDTGVDTKIGFCLAQRTPQNDITIGIDRIQSPLTQMEYSTQDMLLKNLSRWNPRKYINIWVVKDICMNGNCNVAGYAFMPFTHGAPFDGIVIEARHLNSVVLIHEMGHYLGLYHTFKGGCTNDNCLENGDRVCDTPPDKSKVYLPCNVSINSCSTDSDDSSTDNPFRAQSLGGIGDQPDMTQNYMDYGNKRCQDRFTEGQKQRMLFFIESIRYSLIDSKACYPPCVNPVTALFIPDKTDINAGETVIFSNQSQNAKSYKWYANGTLFSSDISPSYTFNKQGQYTILLEAGTTDNACDTQYDSVVINVVCPVTADFDYQQNNTHLDFENKSTNYNSLQWYIVDQNKDTIYKSNVETGSYDFSTSGWYRLCIEAGNDFCSSTNCQYIRIFTSGSEICDNGEDDDGDGLIDLYDSDCPCTDSTYQAYCSVDCQYIPDTFPDFKMKLKWESDLICNFDTFYISPNIVAGDVDKDGIVEILSFKSFGTSNYHGSNSIVIINGKTGKEKYSFDHSNDKYVTRTNIAIAENNGLKSVYFFNLWRFYSYDIQGNFLWESKSVNQQKGTIMNIADFNGDSIAELYYNNKILNAKTGDFLLLGKQGKGCNVGNQWIDCFESSTVAADLLPSPGLELAAGNTVYDIEINNPNDTTGNMMIPVIAESPVKDGLTSVADIDGDGLLDVIVVRSDVLGDGGIWVWNPRTRKIIAQAQSGQRGGIAFIGDVDGDCVPEIGMTFVNELRMYKYNGTKNLKIMYNLPTSDNSGWTGITMFDFNQDGKNELVYRDETDLRIIDGASGVDIATYPVKSVTGAESPIIADIDGDGQAEIVVNGYKEDRHKLRIFAFESAGVPWAPARSVWNQTAYNITNVNDDLTIPAHPQNPAAFIQGTENCLRHTCPQVYNSFMTQATYRTQQGCVQFPTVDLEPKLLNWECDVDSIFISYLVYNLSDALACLGRYAVTVYDANPLTGIAIVLVSKDVDLAIGISSMSDDTFTISIPYQNISGNLYLVINDNASQTAPYVFPITNQPECDYTNNIDSIEVSVQNHKLELGDDIVRCDNEIVTLNAGSGFVSYLWSDGRTDSIFSTSFDGLVYVEATDNCGIVYRDSLMISTDTVTVLRINANVSTICSGDSIDLNVLQSFDSIVWFADEQKIVEKNNRLTIVADTSVLITAIGYAGDCISSDTLTINVKIPVEVEENKSICKGDSLDFYGQEIAEAGIYRYKDSDCDTLHILNLSVIKPVEVSVLESICKGDSVYIGGKWWHNEGKYTLNLISAQGCDSIVNLDLIVNDTFYSEKNIDLCKGDSVLLSGQWVNAEGDYPVLFTSQSGCDSTIMYHIDIVDFVEQYDTIRICVGDSVLINNIWHSQSGIYTDTIDNGQCGIIQTTALEVAPVYLSEDSVTLCPFDSIEVNGEIIKETGTYKYEMNSISGCDSIYILNVEKIQPPEKPVLEIDCARPEVIAKIDVHNNWKIEWNNGKKTPSTVYQDGEQGYVQLKTEPDCEIRYDFEIPELPDLTKLPYFADTLIRPSTAISLKLNLNPNEWQVEWSPANIIDCTTCMDVLINATQDVEISVKLTHNSGCIYSKSFTIRLNLNEDIYIPNIFSPNGDGINDTWYITFKDYNPTIIEAAIFDRWGEKIAEWQDERNIDWDGTFKGQRVLSGVYVYYIKYKDKSGKEVILKGDVTVL